MIRIEGGVSMVVHCHKMYQLWLSEGKLGLDPGIGGFPIPTSLRSQALPKRLPRHFYRFGIFYCQDEIPFISGQDEIISGHVYLQNNYGMYYYSFDGFGFLQCR